MTSPAFNALFWAGLVIAVCSLGLLGLVLAGWILDVIIDRRANRDRREHIAAVTAARVDAPPVLPASCVELERIYRLPAREPRSHA